MKLHTLTHTLLLMALATAGTWAQAAPLRHEPPAPPVTDTAAQHLSLSLAQAQQYAVDHNYTLQNASLELQKTEAAKWQSISSMLPQVSTSFDYSNMMGYKMNMMGYQMEMNPYGNIGLTASLTITGAQIVGILVSNISQQMADISRRQTIQSTYANVKNVYASILVMEETMQLLDSSLANMEQLQRTTDQAVLVGAGEQVDADKLSVQVASLRNTINSNKRSLQLLYNSMLLQLGANVNSTLHLTTPIEDIININEANQLLYHGFNIENNFDYQTLLQGEKVGKHQVALAYMDYLPSLTTFYQYSKRTYFGKDENFNMTPPNMIGASLNWNIFQSGTRLAKVRQAKINYQKTINSKQQAEDGLKVQYKQAAFDLVNALETYDIQKKNKEVTQRVFQNVTEKYKYGRASSLEVTNASTELITAQSNYIQAVVSVINAQVSLEQLMSENQYNDIVLPNEKQKKNNQ